MALSGRGGSSWRRAGRAAALAVGLAAAAGGCGRRQEALPALGRRLVEGAARGLVASPDGAWLAWLDHCARPPAPGLPPDAASCDLRVMPSAGGTPRRLAEGVTTLPGGLAWSGDGRALAALADYDYGTSAGGLVLWRAGREPQRLAGAVGFYGFGPSGELVFAAGGELWLAAPGAEPEPVARAGAIATFEVGPAATRLALARRQASAGGALLLLRDWKVIAETPGPVGDYAFSPGADRVAFTVRGKDGYALRVAAAGVGLGAAPVVGRRVQSFAFSRDGSALAWVADLGPGKPGDLWLAPAAGGPRAAARVAAGVGEFRWAAASPRLAWLQDFDAGMRSGTLAVAGPGARPEVVGHNVTAYDLSPDGERIAFLEHVTAGGYSVDLKLAAGPGGAAATVARGVFGFDFSPRGDLLYFRSACVRNAEACDLYRVPAAGPEAGRRQLRLAEGVKSFEFDRRRPDRLLVTWARRDMVALDLGVWDKGKLLAVDQAAQPGSAAFLPPDGSRLIYLVADPKRAGVYVAALPR